MSRPSYLKRRLQPLLCYCRVVDDYSMATPHTTSEQDEYVYISSAERIDMKIGNRNVPYVSHKVHTPAAV